MAKEGGTGNNVTQHPASNKFNLMTQVRAMGSLISRLRFGQSMGLTHMGKRDLNSVFGWDPTISLTDIQYMYNRGGIARRIAHAYPDAVWGRMPVVYDYVGPGKTNEEWNSAWQLFVQTWNVKNLLWKADVLTGLGRFGIIVISSGTSSLSTPIRKNAGLNFLQAFGEIDMRVKEWDNDPLSPNYGRPKIYQVYPETAQSQAMIREESVTKVRRPFDVHYSRVIHLARGAVENDVYGMPVFAPIWDYLNDLRKVVGSSSESYWLAAYRGMQIDVDKEMELTPDDEAALETEVDEYMHNMRRFMRTRGVNVKPLESDVADPTGSYNVLMNLISGTTSIPKRILLGSEAGQLASEQDKGNWAERVEEYRDLHAEPIVLRPFIRRMIDVGALPQPKGEIRYSWPDAYRMSPLERGQTAAQTARTFANIAKARSTPGQEALITEQEARAMIGLSTDNLVLEDDPDV